MQTETNISLPSKIFRSNSIDFECQTSVNLTTYKIHAELFDRFSSSIELDTANNGGSVDEISITSASEGTFILHIAKDLTDLFHLVSYLEITLIDATGKEQTIWFDAIKFEDNIYLRG
jgi:hypothetical protein